MKRFKVRFHLGEGVNKFKWRIEDTKKGTHEFLVPEEVTLVLTNTFLRNQKGTAQKIFDGANKTVCAWVECDGVLIRDRVNIVGKQRLNYNPRVTPNWVVNGENADGNSYDQLISVGRKLFTI